MMALTDCISRCIWNHYFVKLNCLSIIGKVFYSRNCLQSKCIFSIKTGLSTHLINCREWKNEKLYFVLLGPFGDQRVIKLSSSSMGELRRLIGKGVGNDAFARVIGDFLWPRGQTEQKTRLPKLWVGCLGGGVVKKGVCFWSCLPWSRSGFW